MSSDLLQQAMIDAAALKEAAIKNAENALIEKYSTEFNQTVQKLLEQEDPAAAPPADPAAAPPVGDPSAGGEMPPADAAGMESPDMSAAGVDPMISGEMGMGGGDTTEAFSKVPGSFSGDQDELITINFDQIKAKLNEMLGERYDIGAAPSAMDMTADALSPEKAGNSSVIKITIPKESPKEAKEATGVGDSEAEELELEEVGLTGGSNDQQFEEGLELEEIELEEQTGSNVSLAPAANPVLIGAIQQAEQEVARLKAELDKLNTEQSGELNKVQKQLQDAENKLKELQGKGMANKANAAGQKPSTAMEETIELTEEELQELEESLVVDLDIDNLSDGYMGTTVTQKRQQRVLELAAARDDCAVDEREKEKERMSDLVKENKQLKKMNSDALEALTSLKDQVEKLNVLNGKLLYTNKALGNISLNERQKANIVESISKADSVLAAKTIYETVQNAVENITQEREAPQTLRETLNRAATPFAVKRNANNNINDLMAERMKTLAGIKKLS